jgi:signal transduction histidine kinase
MSGAHGMWPGADREGGDVSKRPKTANTFLSRLRRPFGRLRDMPIWSKLGLIMIVPTLATVVVGTTGLIGHLDTADNANRARTLADLSAVSGELVHDLQDERAAAVLLLGAQNEANKEKYLDVYSKLHPVVDEAKGPYSQQRSALTDLPANFDALLTRIDQSLADLPGTRSQVVNARLKLTDAAQSYEGLISDLLDIRDSATQLAGDTGLSERMRAAAATARAKEFLSVRRIVVHRALIQNALTPVLRTDYIATETGQQQALQTFQAVASREEAEFYEQTVAGSDQREADNYSGWIRGRTSESMADAPFDADAWDAAMVGNAALIRAVESRLDSDVVDQATTLRNDVRQQVFIETGLLLSMLLLAILLAYLVARSMARSLRELRQGALSIAQYGLPHAVSRLRDPALTAHMSPVQVANQIAEPLPVRSRDEFGQVTEAFNAVHLEAVRTAAEQAALRSSVATMFVNLARRSQILVDRLIGHLDRLERGEEDPDRLGELFQLDHLATRMRRNDENLLVLAGADSTRVQREPAALIDVLRAAQSEVEHYTRIEFGVVDRDIEVAAHAVNDLVHLVAELFDNATAFSPPDSQVMVEARRVGDRAVLYVEDRGIGISPDQLGDLNERLATPPQVDVAVSRMMGLVVVARLAARHGVKVELRPGSDRGTVADVTLPTSVLVPRALSGRGQPGSFGGANGGQPGAFGGANGGQPGAFGGANGGQQAPPAQPPQRPAFPAPLALESGPAARDPEPTPAARPFEFDAPLNGGGLSRSGPPSRAMPAWSDLTGARSGMNGGSAFTPRPASNGRGAEPLPQRRAIEEEPAEGEVTTGGPVAGIPRQMPSNPEARSGLESMAPPVPSAPPARPVSAPPVRSAPPAQGQPGAAPPAWPPVSSPERDQATPAVPERLAAALDMTAELPRLARPAPAAPVTAPPPAPAAAAPGRFADETMELPIFRELESAWFRTRRPASEEAAGPGTPKPAAASESTAQFVTADATSGAGQPAPAATASRPAASPTLTSPAAGSGIGNGAAGRRGEATSDWQTAADDGWRAASAAADARTAETTNTGLPKRVPMAQLVPGGVEKPNNSVQRRTPEAVRGLLSAYHRGVQRGRSHPSDEHPTNPEATPAGQQSSQADSGRAAGSSQKEHEG